MAKTNIYIDGTQAGGTLKEIKRNVAVLNKEIAQLEVGSNKYNLKLKALSGENAKLTEHRNQIKGIGEAYQPASAGMGSMLKQFAPMAFGIGAVTTVVGGLVSGIKSWVVNSMQLEKGLSSLRAITGASTDDMKFYKKESKDTAKDMKMAAVDVVEAYKLIGSAKPELLKNKEALASVTKEAIILSQAGEFDLVEAADAVTGSLNQWGESANQAGRYSNAFAAGQQAGSATVKDLSQTMDKAGAILNDYNVTLEEGIGLAETMAEKNIKQSEAGTKLKNVMLTMQTIEGLPDKAMADLERYGINTELVADKTVPLNERLKEMSKISGDATAMMNVFGRENIDAAKAILSNTDKVQEYTKAVTGTQTAYEQAAINMDNMDGDLKAMGSAWEGVTLAFAGSEGVFRPLIQSGTGVLNWLGDTVTAFREFDGTAMETQFMKLTRALPFLSDEMEHLLDRSIRINELSTEVIDAMRGEAESSNVLTSALAENNSKLQDLNITSEEKAAIEEENARIIGTLNEKYPELTENMDLQTASGKELSALQKDINNNLLTQALNAAKAAEAERLLSSIIELTMKQARLRQAVMAGKGKGAFSSEGAAAVEAIMELGDVQKELNNTKNDFKDLEKTMSSVSKTVKEIAPDFGIGYKTNASVANEAMRDLEKAQSQLAKTSNKKDKAILEAQIKGYKGTIAFTKKTRDAQIESATEKQEAEQATTDAIEATEKASNKAAKSAEANYKKIVGELEKLIEATDKLQADFDYNQRLDAFTDEQEKELFALENKLDEKFSKEIASAEELAQQKGDIGLRAQEELDALLILKEEELSAERLKIIGKFAEQKQSIESENQKNANLQYLQQQETLEDAKISLQVYKAQQAFDESQGMSKANQDLAMQNLTDALTAQAELEKQRQLERLMDQRDNGEINIQEFNIRKEEMELEHQEVVNGIINEKEDERQQRAEERAVSALQNISAVIGIFDDLANAQYEKQVANIDKSQKKELASIEEKKRKGLITEDEFAIQKAEIEARGEEEMRAAKNEQAKKDKAMAIVKATIATAIAVAEAGNPVLAAIAGAIGIAQIAIIAGQELPQYAEGGYTSVIGANDGKHYNAKNVGRIGAGLTPSTPSLALISEEGPEYFVPNGLLRNHAVAQHVSAIDAIRTNQYAEGGYTSSPGAMGNDQLTAFLNANLVMLTALNAKIPNMGVNIGDQQLDAMAERKAEFDQMRN